MTHLKTAIPSGARCLQCGYDLRSLPESRCPECGRPFDPPDSMTMGIPARFPRTRRWLLLKPRRARRTPLVLWAVAVAGVLAPMVYQAPPWDFRVILLALLLGELLRTRAEHILESCCQRPLTDRSRRWMTRWAAVAVFAAWLLFWPIRDRVCKHGLEYHRGVIHVAHRTTGQMYHGDCVNNRDPVHIYGPWFVWFSWPDLRR